MKSVIFATLLATASAWSTTGCPTPPCMEDCWIKDSCSKCVADVNCGWCAVTKTCMEGVIMGPLSSNCSAWDYAFCSGEPCATYRTCGTCMSDPFCGWCPSTQLCSEGNKNGPLFGKCGDWEHGAMQSGCNSDGPPQAEADGPPTGADSSAEAPAGGLKNDATLSNAAPIDASPKAASAAK